MSSPSVPARAAQWAQKPVRWPMMLLLGLAATLVLALALTQWVTSKTQFGIDFFVYWRAGQAVFFDRSSPYTPEFTLATQHGLYGRAALPGEDVKGFAYPPYSLLAVIPTLGGSYPWGLALWLAINLVVLMTAVHIAFPRTPLWVKLTVPVFYPIAYGLVMGQFSVLLIGAGLLVSAALATGGRDLPWAGLAGGGLLAWMAIKPQMTWPLIAFFLLVAWRAKNWWALAGFVCGEVVLLSVSAWLVPGWIGPWINQLLSGTDETLMAAPLALEYARWLTPQGWELATALALGLLFILALGWLGRQWSRRSLPDGSLLAWLIAAGLLIHPLLMSPDQALMVLPLLGIGLAQDGPGWGRRYWPWFVALIIPWVLLLLPLGGMNSYAVTKLPPALFMLWALFTVGAEIAANKKDASDGRN